MASNSLQEDSSCQMSICSPNYTFGPIFLKMKFYKFLFRFQKVPLFQKCLFLWGKGFFPFC